MNSMTATGNNAPGPEAFLALAERLADTARTEILPHFRSALEVEAKADLSPVTAIDRAAEVAMRRIIAETFPEHGVVGEEYGSEDADAAYVWALDPIDGTLRFITGNPLFGTLIALCHGGRPVLGIIDMTVLDERWIGLAGRPSLHRSPAGEREVRVRACPALDQATLTATTPHQFPGSDFLAFERVRKATSRTLYGGDCLNYGLLSDGFTDLAIEATMGVHDYLPLVPVIEGAGGVITDWSGAALGLESDGRIVAAGDRRVHEAALELLQGN